MPLYYQREGWEETKRRCIWGYGRLSARMEEVAKRITYEDEGLTRLLKEAIREAGLKRFDGKEGESMNGWRGCKGNMSPLRRRPCFRSGGSQQFFSQSQVVRKLRYELLRNLLPTG